MSLDTYANLKTEIAAWTHRDDLTNYLDTFIDLTETELNNKLRMSEMENSTSITITSGDFTLPTGFLEMREVHLSGSPDKTMEYLTPFQFTLKDNNESGSPKYYTIEGDAGKTYPRDSSTLEMVFYKSITALDSTNTSNFVLTRFPMIYLHGCLKHAYVYARDMEAAQIHGMEFDRLVKDANKMSRDRKTGGMLRVVAA